METQNKKHGLRSLVASSLVGLSALTQGAFAQTNQVAPVKTSGDVTYFVSEEAKSPSQNSYAEINHSTKLPHGTSVSGFMDLYRNDAGYFGKTVVEQSLTDRLNLRSHVMHINEPLSQAGIGVSYRLPTPKGTFAKASLLPYFADTKGEKIKDKQIAAYFVQADLPFNSQVFSFGEINIDGTKGSQWGYGEVEVAKKVGDRVSVGLNVQLNGKGAGETTPEFVPRGVIRAKW
jgi:hypothetical protein